MTDGESRFVEEMGQMLASYGMTPMAGRMWGWLLICEPPEQTAAEIADALHASRGAISGTARLLATSGMIRRSTRRGDRREYFSAPPETLDSFLANAGRMYSQFRALSERGLEAIADRPPESKRRIEELRDVFAFVEREVPAVIDRFLRDRAGAARREAGAAGREAGAARREAGAARREAGSPGTEAGSPGTEAGAAGRKE